MSAALTYDQGLAYPSYDKPFLESWNGRFEAVLVVLHPFFTLAGVQPVQDGFVVTPHAQSVSGRAAFQRIGDPELDASDPLLAKLRGSGSLLASIGHPDGRDWITEAKPIAWHEVAAIAGLADIARVGSSLSGLIGGLRNEFVVQADVRRLAAFCEEESIFLPTEGSFQPLLLEPIADFLGDRGEAVILYQAEFETDPVRALSKSDVAAGEPWRGSLYDPDKRRLAVVDWDSHFMLVAGARAELEKWRSNHALDAFFADETTRHHWWFQPTNLN